MSLLLSIRYKTKNYKLEFANCQATSWSDVVREFKTKARLRGNFPWAFEYYDDEGDFVLGKSESEWKAAIATAASLAEDIKVFHVEAIELGHYDPKSDDIAHVSEVYVPEERAIGLFDFAINHDNGDNVCVSITGKYSIESYD